MDPPAVPPQTPRGHRPLLKTPVDSSKEVNTTLTDMLVRHAHIKNILNYLTYVKFQDFVHVLIEKHKEESICYLPLRLSGKKQSTRFGEKL